MKCSRELGQNWQIDENRIFEKHFLSLGKIGQNRLKPIFPIYYHKAASPCN